jgi:hypothetical protein
LTNRHFGIAGDEESAQETPRAGGGRRWLAWIIAMAAALWIVNAGLSLLIQHTRLNRKFTEHLEAAFGRPVEVGRYEFRLWAGPALEAESVVVAEDPRFGNEYFLRAESLTVRLRWLSLLRGRLELGTLSLSHPSLNLVRNPNGDWNLYEWLPRPAGTPAANAPPRSQANPPMGPIRSNAYVLRFQKIEIDGGRINFKSGVEKLPFAFVHVAGTVETESAGRWRIDLNATPMRAATAVQQPGTLHLTGSVGGTSSRLKPATLELTWRDAALTDVLRLARSYDYGVHGGVALLLDAQTEGDDWLLSGRAEFRQIHRWDLAIRPDNPSLNLIAQGKLNLPGRRLDVTHATLETPHSNVHAMGRLDWSGAKPSARSDSPGTRLDVNSDSLAMSEALAWLRAFHATVAEDLELRGTAKLKMTLRGWPLQLTEGSLSTGAGELTGKELRAEVRIGAGEANYDAKGLRISPVAISVGATQTTLTAEGSARLGAVPASQLRVTGGMDQLRDILTISKALGWDISGGWDFGGPWRCDLRWQGGRIPWRAEPTGNITWGSEAAAGTIRAPFLNQPIEGIRARVDFKAGDRHVTLESAQAFGARWSGTLDGKRSAEPEWQFALAADRLSAAELDLWLNPRWRESFLDRMLPFLNPSAQAGAAPDNLRASGRLGVGELTLGTLEARKLQGELTLDGRRIEFANVTGQIAGGTLSGSLDAGVVAPPAYHAGVQWAGVEVGQLTANAPGLARLFAGAASGEISLHARGANRADLLASLECEGTARVANAGLREINLAESIRSGTTRAGTSEFREANATFTCANRAIHFRQLNFGVAGAGKRGASGAATGSASAEIEGTGSVDFLGGLDLRMEETAGGGESKPRAENISGTTARAGGAAGAAAQVSGTARNPIFRKIAAAKPQ